MAFLDRDNTVLLVDNIDDILVYPRKANLPSRYLSSALITLIDILPKKGSIIIATCSDIHSLHPSSQQPYRFELISIPGPSAEFRRKFFRNEVTRIMNLQGCQPDLRVFDKNEDYFESATHSLSFGELYNTISRFILDLQIYNALNSKF